MNFRAAIIGCGMIGSEYDDDPKRKAISSHAGAYSSIKGIDLVAVADTNINKTKKCQEKWGVPSSYLDAKEMLKKESIDVLSICTDTKSHAKLVKEAVKHGVKAIFCEKPLAQSLREADEVINLCKKNRTLLFVDHQRRFDRFHQKVREHIVKGRLGAMQQASFYYAKGISNSGSHMFDLMRFFFGEVKWVQAFSSKNDSCLNSDPNVEGIVEFKSGLRCFVHALDISKYSIFELDIYGSKGRIRITNYGSGCQYYGVRQSKQYSGFKELCLTKSPFGTPASESLLVRGVEHIINCLRKKEKPLNTGEDGRAALELITAFKKSAATGKKISLR